MTQYIDKNRVEEILKNLWKEDNSHNSEHRICYNKAIQEVQCELDTLEVKEVDLEKEVCDWYNNRYKPIDKNCDFEKHTGHWLKKSTIIELAKHFFELGLKAKEGE